MTMTDGTEVVAFDLDGDVDVKSGIDIFANEIALTVLHGSGEFSLVVGDLTTGEIVENVQSKEFVGQPRWSPNGFPAFPVVIG